MGNSITIQLKKNEIWIKIKEEAEEKEILESLKVYKDDTTPIKITGKVLKNKEMEEIQKTIKEKIDVEIEFESPKTLGLARNKKIV